jgi:hypothetical protein
MQSSILELADRRDTGRALLEYLDLGDPDGVSMQYPQALPKNELTW